MSHSKCMEEAKQTQAQYERIQKDLEDTPIFKEAFQWALRNRFSAVTAGPYTYPIREYAFRCDQCGLDMRIKTLEEKQPMKARALLSAHARFCR